MSEVESASRKGTTLRLRDHVPSLRGELQEAFEG
jgi:hypothetical protein